MKSSANFYDHNKVSALIEGYCKENNINQGRFAVLVGRHETHISRVKAGKMASMEVLAKIASLCKVPLQDLIITPQEKSVIT
jgi:hypothetical protein